MRHAGLEEACCGAAGRFLLCVFLCPFCVPSSYSPLVHFRAALFALSAVLEETPPRHPLPTRMRAARLSARNRGPSCKPPGDFYNARRWSGNAYSGSRRWVRAWHAGGERLQEGNRGLSAARGGCGVVHHGGAAHECFSLIRLVCSQVKRGPWVVGALRLRALALRRWGGISRGADRRKTNGIALCEEACRAPPWQHEEKLDRAIGPAWQL
jgi:hypothetical protein